MIAHLEGRLREKDPTRAVLDVGGVGYEVFIPVTTFYELPDPGKTVALRIHTHAREGAIQLFGFRAAKERALFERLLRTNGVGPKLALAILSGIEVEPLVDAVRRGDVASLRKVPGLGTKKAERLLVELRDRIDGIVEPSGEAATPGTGPGAAGPEAGEASQASLSEQTVSALQNLGYPRHQAEKVVATALQEFEPEDPPIETLIRSALRRLSR